MASAIILLGSLFGFAAGLFSWLAFGLPFLAALAIWIGSGPVAAVIVLSFGLLAGGARPAPQLVKA